MKKTLPILLFLIFTGVLAGQLKISQYPNTNNLATTQRFIVTAGGTNMNITWAQLLSLIGRDSTNFSSITVSNDMLVLGSMHMANLYVNDISVTTSVAASSASFTNLVSTNASFGVLRGTLSVSNAANSQRQSYVDDGEGWQFFYGGLQWTFDPTASTGIPHRSEITAHTNLPAASANGFVVSNTLDVLGTLSLKGTGTNYFSNSVEVVSGQFRGNGGGLTNVGEVLTASNSLYTVSSNVASALAASAAATASNTLYTTSSNIAQAKVNEGSNSLYTVSSNVARSTITKYATNVAWNVDLPERGNRVSVTNTLGGSTANVWLTNVVDGGWFTLRILADGTARTVSVTNASGLTINVIQTNNFTVLTLPQVSVTASKILTLVGSATVVAGTTNVDIFANVQP